MFQLDTFFVTNANPNDWTWPLWYHSDKEKNSMLVLSSFTVHHLIWFFERLMLLLSKSSVWSTAEGHVGQNGSAHVARSIVAIWTLLLFEWSQLMIVKAILPNFCHKKAGQLEHCCLKYAFVMIIFATCLIYFFKSGSSFC